MLFKVMGIIGKVIMYILAGIVVLWLCYIFTMGAINTTCDCQRELEQKRRGLIAPFFICMLSDIPHLV
jgi:hypothetical protein